MCSPGRNRPKTPLQMANRTDRGSHDVYVTREGTPETLRHIPTAFCAEEVLRLCLPE